MKRLTYTKIAGTVIALACATAGYWVGRAIPFAEQWPVYDGLRQTASIIFGIAGAWAAIVYPATLATILKKRGKTTPEEESAVSHLLVPLVMSTLVIATVLSAAFLAPLARKTPWLVEHAQLLRGSSFALLGILTVFELFAILYLLVPFDQAKSDVDRASAQQKIIRDLRGPDGDDDDELP